MQMIDDRAVAILNRGLWIENGYPSILVVVTPNLNRGEISRGVPPHGIDRDRTVFDGGLLFIVTQLLSS